MFLLSTAPKFSSLTAGVCWDESSTTGDRCDHLLQPDKRSGRRWAVASCLANICANVPRAKAKWKIWTPLQSWDWDAKGKYVKLLLIQGLLSWEIWKIDHDWIAYGKDPCPWFYLENITQENASLRSWCELLSGKTLWCRLHGLNGAMTCSRQMFVTHREQLQILAPCPPLLSLMIGMHARQNLPRILKLALNWLALNWLAAEFCFT